MRHSEPIRRPPHSRRRSIDDDDHGTPLAPSLDIRMRGPDLVQPVAAVDRRGEDAPGGEPHQQLEHVASFSGDARDDAATRILAMPDWFGVAALAFSCQFTRAPPLTYAVRMPVKPHGRLPCTVSTCSLSHACFPTPSTQPGAHSARRNQAGRSAGSRGALHAKARRDA